MSVELINSNKDISEIDNNFTNQGLNGFSFKNLQSIRHEINFNSVCEKQ